MSRATPEQPAANDALSWNPTRHGGLRRTRVAQLESAGRINQRSVARNHPRVLIRRAEKLGLPECPYVIRWRIETPFGSLRVHHWLGPDDDRAFHDHPWWFLTLVLRGGYTDKNPGGDEHLAAGSVRYRPALHRHTVVPDAGGAWTVLLTGRPLRTWGFWLDGKFRKANKWFLAYGHHPCTAGRPTAAEMDDALRDQLAEDAEMLATTETQRDVEWDDEADRTAKCSLCTAPVIVHDDGSTTGGVDTLLGIRCDSCLNAPANAKEGTAR